MSKTVHASKHDSEHYFEIKGYIHESSYAFKHANTLQEAESIFLKFLDSKNYIKVAMEKTIVIYETKVIKENKI